MKRVSDIDLDKYTKFSIVAAIGILLIAGATLYAHNIDRTTQPEPLENNTEHNQTAVNSSENLTDTPDINETDLKDSGNFTEPSHNRSDNQSLNESNNSTNKSKKR